MQAKVDGTIEATLIDEDSKRTVEAIAKAKVDPIQMVVYMMLIKR